MMSKHVNNLLYMPVIDINTDRGQALFSEYVEREVVPMAFEICWNEPGKQIDDRLSFIHRPGADGRTLPRIQGRAQGVDC